ncbi:MAG: efflux RND transporter permease subunit [Gammaproteobacteria bacterium]|nr:efflux RND transporter permease subunit [Gammaproteobacteria bacterium]MBT4195910.1 efflux RND transporter permease subunit [Gammaproteobacteria bacterium]MBT4451491.1 efflux RND transporter permease subunit [Gammaproteobacteria bacterium]MBT4861463.1 efflux RND transporter permease subunit [Gammaproteobacteria bacterium]MBT6455446.1 efflux RND transporter permease subunit [Gammaproteobacteria bacterium]
MHSIINGVLSRSRTMVMIFILLITSGLISYINIPKESEPDIDIPYIYVSMSHDGISPEDAERMLVRPMENKLKSIDGIKEMTSRSSEGHASVTLEFIAGFDSGQALDDVQEKVTAVKAELPDDTDEPVINQITMADQNPVITISISGELPERALVQLARDLSDKLEAFTEVLEVELTGDRIDQLEVILDPLAMESYGLDQQDIFQFISRNNRLITAGTMDTGKGRFAVKIPAVFENIEDIMNLPVKSRGDLIVKFKDVTSVRRSYKDPTSFARLNAKKSISLEVKKRPGENSISTVEKIKILISEEQKSWPEHLILTYSADRSEEVKDMLNDLQNNVVSAILLVVIIIIAFLGVRTATLVGLSIPGSFLSGLLILALMGYTINIVVLFALIMAVGMLVDGSIVVTEYADRVMNEGVEPKQAFSMAARRMAWPITASTATTLAAFAPLIFWPGIMGEFMKYLPITLIATLSASLFMALLFVPTLGGMLGRPRQISSQASKRLLQMDEGDIYSLDGFTGFYVRILNRAMQHAWKVIIATLIFAAAIFSAYSYSGLGMQFFPDVEPEGGNIYIRGYGALSIYEKDALMTEVESRLVDMDEIETLYTYTGGRNRIGRFRYNLVDWQKRRKAVDIIEEMNTRVADIAGIEIEIGKDESGINSGKDIEIELSSRFPELMQSTALKIRQTLEKNPKLKDIDDTRSKPGIEWRLEVDRANAARFDADAALVGNMVQLVTNGLKVGEYRPDDVDEELGIRIRFPHKNRSIDRLDELRIRTDNGFVPISNFVKRVAVPKIDTIEHINSRRVYQVKANMVDGELLSLELPELKKQLATLDIDPRVNIEIKGENTEQQDSQEFLQKAFLVALFVMAIILVTQFNSFYQAFLILSAVLFSTVGVFLGLLIFQKPFGIVMSGIGVISLAGIIVNNNIVLIDTYNVLRKKGMLSFEAILRTGAQRLRPVLLTTVTTILGLAPMVMEMNIDLVNRNIEFGGPSTQWWSQLATAVAGGLAFATILTLILTPCMLSLASRRSEKAVEIKN